MHVISDRRILQSVALEYKNHEGYLLNNFLMLGLEQRLSIQMLGTLQVFAWAEGGGAAVHSP